MIRAILQEAFSILTGQSELRITKCYNHVVVITYYGPEIGHKVKLSIYFYIVPAIVLVLVSTRRLVLCRLVFCVRNEL